LGAGKLADKYPYQFRDYLSLGEFFMGRHFNVTPASLLLLLDAFSLPYSTAVSSACGSCLPASLSFFFPRTLGNGDDEQIAAAATENASIIRTLESAAVSQLL